MTCTPDIVPTVQRGAAVLDERHPGWHNRIDLDLLDLRQGDRCVIGQLYGGDVFAFSNGLDDLSGEDEALHRYDWAGEHGFYVIAEDPDEDVDYDEEAEAETAAEYEALTVQWRRLIEQRRTEAA